MHNQNQTKWFGNDMWVSGTTSMNTLHYQYAAGLYERQLEQERQKAEQEAKQLEELKEVQGRTGCYDSAQCASGFACVGSVCVYVDPTGATADGGTAGCGAGPGGSANGGGTGGGAGGGCGGTGASTGGGGNTFDQVTIGSCTTSSAGICPGRFVDSGGGSGGNGGGGGRPCGGQCCSCGTNGCTCSQGACPPPAQTCSRFCQSVSALGGSVMQCSSKRCKNCEKCVDSGGEPGCVADTLAQQNDCRCGGECPGCDTCSPSGNCLRKNCPVPQEPPEDEADPDRCQPVCTTSDVCVRNTESGTITCTPVEQCGDLPSSCEPCDCSCNEDCPSCERCNEGTGLCEPDPACDPPGDNCQGASMRVYSSGASYGFQTVRGAFSPNRCQAASALTGGGAVTTRVVSASCGPLQGYIAQQPDLLIEGTGYGFGCGPGDGPERQRITTLQPGIWRVIDGNGDVVDEGYFGGAQHTGAITSISVTDPGGAYFENL